MPKSTFYRWKSKQSRGGDAERRDKKPIAKSWPNQLSPDVVEKIRHEFQAKFHWHVEDKGIRHVYIKPRSPQLNGKVERPRTKRSSTSS